MSQLSQNKLYLSIGAGIAVFAAVALIAYRMGEKVAEDEVSGEVEGKVLERQPTLRKKPTLIEKTTSAGTEAENINDIKLEHREGVTFQNGAVYSGQMNGEERHGKGTQVWPDGAKYEGTWEYG